MQFIADFHLHSKYSRATSRDMDVDNLDKWAKIKGIKVLGTGDFTHPLWLKELKEKLEPAEPGLFKIKNNKKSHLADDWLSSRNNQDNGTRFLLTSEISCIYSKNNRTRKIHLIVFAPNFQVVEKINTHLGWIGNLKSDGRPILGLDAKELAKIILNISGDCLIVPSHFWTPWFSLFGSMSGFDSIEECFDEYSKYIYAGETGLSSDPLMNWRLSALDKITLISNGDAHSPAKLGREANVFEGDEINYKNIIEAIKSGGRAEPSSPIKLISTIEFFPEEGKYHFDGHRNCQISLSPQESKKIKNICPKCGRPLTVGVLHRVDDLADRQEGEKPDKAASFRSLIPLEEIIAEAFGVGAASKRVREEYKNLIRYFGQEFEVLLEAKREQIEQAGSAEIAEGVMRVREGKVYVEPGYDGEYGKIKIFKDEERGKLSKQASLF
ncbi:MAG: DNA helicase UvrD [Candidatus Portnoybacteria bacterium RIFCSPLOWO2_12_FULL_39_9]|uniref:DNA helicase UvrD n=1 Tax=Candidatus Portnoybacteria bacterium RIFCSPHIGHO2_12_FULL_38_9 TaxID=1801997 RepID=A0A1G2FDP0_9BACT|nr:MAG: DNA helicase UvrD [Candidatus Portnoybacteria bacterium RBG_13_40_8]OGZ36179.1 MAG: DNA helicase UvrD [Candidatus Portnoybacteria bacterium RIFCSPHIGHO2_12_FULL_38_9]OGZ37205.1 MAG: DNA helicase UvrD [Candidatus Portnoybacteria bacterium RIFCSPHIGHO2_02_FULL_39_12]OGZ38584.1 MAG: DNA helicase UvrD [Candidatus Portnoybacteria bacterium RIFCSPLOWO2_01_FULL_38_39]OGZ41225.1 MAG: DNA helicase UvrD [Candidatus Portnoybacteria bacterium RIFCSPLOWO2_12_FULL_39_9]